MDQTAPRAIGTATRAVDPTVDARTGEPRRPAVVWAASGLFFAGGARFSATAQSAGPVAAGSRRAAVRP